MITGLALRFAGGFVAGAIIYLLWLVIAAVAAAALAR